MRYLLVTIAEGIIDQVIFFDNPETALYALANYVERMNVEHNDAAVYGPGGFVANAKHFLDENDQYFENSSLIEEVSRERTNCIYLIGNPQHRLGFMVASPDDPLGYQNPAEAVSEIGQMRKYYGMHLKLYRLFPVTSPIARRTDVERIIADSEVEGFDHSLIEEYIE